MNLAPELFAGVHAAVPFVDPLTSILDPSLPLTVTEWEEWGDPLHDPEVYAYIQGYAPYENVPADASHYPPVLATTSLHDTRVLYVEPAKWVARLRAAGAPALLRIEMSAGHGGVSGRYARGSRSRRRTPGCSTCWAWPDRVGPDPGGRAGRQEPIRTGVLRTGPVKRGGGP